MVERVFIQPKTVKQQTSFTSLSPTADAISFLDNKSEFVDPKEYNTRPPISFI